MPPKMSARQLAESSLRDYERATTDAERTRVWQEATLGLLAVLVTQLSEPAPPGNVVPLRSAGR